jgi:hypothetical protein
MRNTDAPLHHALEKLTAALACFAVSPLMFLLFASPGGHWLSLIVGIICIAGGFISLTFAWRHWRTHRDENKSGY